MVSLVRENRWKERCVWVWGVALPGRGHVKLMGICVSALHSSTATARGRGDCTYVNHQILVPLQCVKDLLFELTKTRVNLSVSRESSPEKGVPLVPDLDP